MKRLLTITLAIVLVLTITVSASAAQFVESITNKGAPELVVIDVVDGKEVVGFITGPDGNRLSTEYLECLIISSITEALSGADLPEGVKEELLKVYDEFNNGAKLSDLCPALTEIVKEKWGADKNVDDLVIKDLFDVTDVCDNFDKFLTGEGSTLDLTFDIGIASGTFITAMVYVDGKWVPVVDCINNGDGTVTVKFDQICPVAFLVPGSGQNMDVVSPTTSDASNVVFWSAIMVLSLGAVLALIVYRRKVKE
ncbi:MAG: hypothetical protein IJO20_01665 [Ruminococcus sp.]|nr:hypothetical protein [Ruminococcus sp.]